MSGIEKNRVYDGVALEELKTQITAVLETAQEVTEALGEEMKVLLETAEEVPAQARCEGLPAAAAGLSRELEGQPYQTLRTRAAEKLDELKAQIPSGDSASASIMNSVTEAAGELAGMVEELKGLIGQGSLKMGLEEFCGRLEEQKASWERARKELEARMLQAMTYLKGMVGFSEYSRDPVNLSTGNFYYEREDMRIRGRKPLVLKRHYNALDRSGGAMGIGWSHSLEERLTFTGKGKERRLVLHLSDGQEIAFEPGREERAGVWRDVRTGTEELQESGAGYCRRKGGETSLFDTQGRLTRKENRDGNAIRYCYDERGRLEKVEQSPAGGFFHFSYREDGSLKSVTDHTGRSTEYFYMDGRLSEVTDAEGNVTCYRYDASGRMRAVKNARGILTVRNEYDEKGRISRQRFPDKGEMSYAYDEEKNATTLTERNGSRITYVQDERLRNVRIIYHDSEETSTYDGRDCRTSYTDRNGNTTRYCYDGKGVLTAIIDALGTRTDLAYDGEGRLLSVRCAGQETVRNEYDGAGRLIGRTDALGRKVTMSYDGKGQVSAVTAPDGSVTEYAHDGRGNIVSITDSYGVRTTYAYDELNRVIRTTDASGNETHYRYDRKDRLTEVVCPEGSTRRYSYGAGGKVERAEDFDGTVTTVTYNELNRPQVLTDKEGRQTKRRYDLMWNLSEEISPAGTVTRYTYDEDNRLCKAALYRAEGEEPVKEVRYCYDAAGNLTLIETNGEPTAAYEYDALNRVVRSVDSMGGETRCGYDELGRLRSVTGPTGAAVTYTYDAAGELIEEKDSEGRTVTYEYNALGQPLRITDAAGRTTVHTYEKGGRLSRTDRADGRSISYTYDNKGNVRTKEDSEGHVITYSYDCMDRVTKVEWSDGRKESYTYDVMGNVTSVTDAEGNTTAYEYTPGGKLSAVTDALGERTQYRYDALGALILIERQGEGGEGSRRTEYIRNSLGQIEIMRDALGREESYGYDAFGRIREKTDRDGHRTVFGYEADGRMKSILYADGKSVEMEYDALRRLILVKDWLGVTKIERDGAGRIEAVTDHMGRTVSYRYGKAGERTEMTYPDGRTVNYRYDGLLRLTEMDLPGVSGESAGTVSYRYDEAGRLTEKCLPGGLRTHWQYDRNGEVSQIVHEDGEGVLDSYTYEYGPMGNTTAITKERRGLQEESGRYEYGYDAMGRLAEVRKDGAVLRSYAYDPFGNRSLMEDCRTGRTSRYVYDALDRLTERRDSADGRESVRRYLYDNRGNLTQETQEGKQLHSYSYNAMNRMESAQNGNGESAAYEYNGLGQRTSRRSGGSEESYLLDLTRPYHNLLSVTGEDGAQARTFYWDGNAVAMEEEDELHCYLQDAQGSPLRVSGYGNGYLTYGYDEYGNDLRDDGYDGPEGSGIPSPYSRQGKEQPFGYTGYRHDEISGTYFAQAREYRPQDGRFTAQDVIQGNGAMPETLNRYGYCWGNPIGLVDLNGLTPEEEKCSLYYLNNMDGAKIFGHNAILLVDSEGNGEFYSFMSSNPLKEALMGKSSVGYMGYEKLTKEEVDTFLSSGDIDVTMANGSENHDNYDRALKRDISYDEYAQIQEGLSYYVARYNDRENIEDQSLDTFIESLNGTGYNLYEHNCDDVTLEAIAMVDASIKKNYDNMIKTTPNNSFAAVLAMADESWEIIKIGNNNFYEWGISAPVACYVFYGLIVKGGTDCETE